jgi:DNA-binding MarR family transcriptional regulator
MPKPELSGNEMRTLLGLVKYPTLNDRQLSERIGIKMSTVTAIKNRLKDQGYFMTVRVPKLQRLGAELLSVSYAQTDPSLPEEPRLEVGRKVLESFDETFYIGAAPRYRFSMGMHRNYSAARATLDGVLRLYSQNKLLVPDMYNVVLFPFDSTRVLNFFDYSQLLERSFGMDLPPRDDGGTGFEGVSTVALSPIEAKVLKGLIFNPDLLDSNIAKVIDVTRQTVTKMRKKFTEQDLFFTVRVPNLRLLGFELVAFIHTTYLPSSTLESRLEAAATTLGTLPLVFKAEGGLDGVEIVATRGYREFAAYYDALDARLRDARAIGREPTVLLFTLEEFQTVKNHVYTPCLSRVVDRSA